MKNSTLKIKNPCSGCSACYAICPHSAVDIKLNDDGFYEAKINENCSSCGMCNDVCRMHGTMNTSILTNGELVAAQSKNQETIRNSTSGGIAHELTMHALNKGYSTVGVVYDSSENIAKAISAHDAKTADLFRGSKYLQAKTDEAYRAVLSRAIEQTKTRVIIFGTPCHIYGLACVAEKMKVREQFLLVDFYCHGVPSYLVWNSYLKRIFKDKKTAGTTVTSCTFRGKENGWHNSYLMHIQGKRKQLAQQLPHAHSEGSFEYKKSAESDLFYNAYFDNVLLSPACFNCDLRMHSSKADIKLGDYWGKQYKNRDDGVSAVLLLSERGKSFFRELDSIEIFSSHTNEEVKDFHPSKYYETKKYYNDAVTMLRDTGDLKKTVRYYRRRFTAGQRIKLSIKRSTALLPVPLRVFFKRLYKKVFKEG